MGEEHVPEALRAEQENVHAPVAPFVEKTQKNDDAEYEEQDGDDSEHDAHHRRVCNTNASLSARKHVARRLVLCRQALSKGLWKQERARARGNSLLNHSS